MRLSETSLTETEVRELGEKIAGGAITRSCPRARVDWFNVRLSSGRRVAGSYAWDAEDWIDLRVYGRNGRRV